MQSDCYLQSEARWYSFALQPAATMRCSCCAKPKLPDIELNIGLQLSLGYAVLSRQQL